MDAIKSYLENMFLHLPKTAEVLRAKDELFQMMEDKYNQLRSEGRTDNEAVGQVIAEFGNLDELAADLGIRNEVSALDSTESEQINLTDQDVEGYLSVTRESGRQVAGGVSLILIGVVILIMLQTFADMGMFEERVAQAIGIGGLLLLVAIAVFMFIMAGVKTDQYESLETKMVYIDPYLRSRIKLQKDAYVPAFGRTIAIGVLLIMLGVIGLVTIAILEVGGYILLQLSVVAFLILIAIAVGLFIMAGTKMNALDKLLNEGDYTRRRKEQASIMQPFAGLYWMMVLAGYLAWSFLSDSWSISWIVWPISGVLFTIISRIVSIARRNS